MSADIHELLGITIHSKLTLKKHFNELYKKESQKLNALGRISHFMYGFWQRKDNENFHCNKNELLPSPVDVLQQKTK